MNKKEYTTPQCETVFMVADTSFLLIASAGGEGEAGIIDDEFVYDL